jgi:hypothetical protein
MPTVKLAVTSDLHLPITPSTAVADVARAVAEFAPDALVVAGDVGESLADVGRCLGVLKLFVSCPVWVLAGNHDQWARGATSKRLWAELLPRTVEEAGCLWLEGKTFVLGGVGVAGSIAWDGCSGRTPAVKGRVTWPAGPAWPAAGAPQRLR